MRRLPRLGHGRGRRGATLLVTVLVATVAASIVVIMVQLALFSLARDVRSSAYEAADSQLESMRQELATVLAQDPLAVYSRVLDWELPRVCLPRSLRLEGDSVVFPGQQWPQECGYVWGYSSRPTGSSLEGSGVALSPPGPGRPYFEVLSISRSAEVSLAVRDYFALGGAVRPRAYSAGPLSLTALRTGTVDVPIYSYGALDVDVSTLALGSLVASENGLDFDPVFNPSGLPSGGAVLAGPSADPGPPPIVQVRDVYPQPMPLGLLRSSVSALADLGCPVTSSAKPPVNGVPSWSSSLCLRPGAWVTPLSLSAGQWLGSSADTPVQVPASAKAFLVLPAAAPSGAVRVLYSTVEPTVPSLSTPVTATHPGSELFWTELGVFFVPGSGVIHSSLTTYVGLCGALFATGPCASWGSGEGSAVFAENFLLVAGTPSDPADVVLAGPVRSSSQGRVGVVASGSVVVPFFVSPAVSPANLDLDMAVLGVNAQSSLLRADPTSPPASRSTVRFTGLRLGKDLSALTGVFSSLTWTFPKSLDGSSPWLPSPELRFERVVSERVAPDEAALSLTGRPGPS